MMNSCNFKKVIDGIFVLSSFLLILLYLFPYFVWGEDNYINIGDSLDHAPAIFKIFRKSGIFNMGVPTGVMDNTSSLFFFGDSLSVTHLLYYCFSPYYAYVINICIGVIVGFIAMYRLELKVFRLTQSAPLLFVAALYSILPTIPIWVVPMAFLPVIVMVLLNLYNKESNYYKCIFLCFVLPFFLSFTLIDLFICAFLGVIMLYFDIKDKSLNKKWTLAFLAFTSGVVLFNIKLFYMQLFSGIDLNRAHFIITSKEGFLKLFSDYFFIGYIQVMHKIKLFMPLFFLCLMVCMVKIVKAWNKEKRIIVPSLELKVFLLCFSLHFICALLAAADGSGMFESFKSFMVILKGFSFDRLYGFCRLWGYLSIAAVILYITRIKNGTFYIFALVLLLVHSCKVYTSLDEYNEAYKTTKYHITNKPDDSSLTWNEFYDEELFSEIKKAINYNHEPVVAVGYHAMVLCYNDFNCIDGYIPIYPYADKLKFRKLIEPELKVWDDIRKYYDETGRKRYVYNSEIGYLPTRTEYKGEIQLNINMDVFKNGYGGKYIFSLAKLSNKKDLGLDFVGTFHNPKGVYHMNVYKVHSK